MNYDFEKYFKAIDEAILEAAKNIRIVFDVITGKSGMNVLDEALVNINMQGALVIPLEEKKRLRKAKRKN